MAKSDIVFGSEFSPSVVDLPRLLELVEIHAPDRESLQQAIDAEFFPDQSGTGGPRKTLGDNTILSLCNYEIIQRAEDDPWHVDFTTFGRDLYQHRNDENALQEMMGRHCLVNLDGLRVINCIHDLMAGGTRLKKTTIAERLREEGLHVPLNGKHLNVLRQWLDYAGVLNPSDKGGGEGLWQPDDSRIEEITGAAQHDIDQWRELTQAQHDFARAFALLDADEVASNEVRDYAVALYGTDFPARGLPMSVLHQLQKVGLLQWEKTTAGRGAKAHLVRKTDKLKNEFLPSILEQIADEMGPGYKRLSRMSLQDIVDALDSDDTHEKGIALEALAFYFCRRLDLQFVHWRLRGAATGGAEVDMLVEGSRLIFSRWQIQCKNKKTVRVADLAKEVGMAVALRSTVILFVTRADIGPSLAHYRKRVMENTALQIIMLSGQDLQQFIDTPAKLTALLNEQAEQAMEIKRVQIGDE